MRRALIFIPRVSVAALVAILLIAVGCKPKPAPISYEPPPEQHHPDAEETSKAIPSDLFPDMPMYPGIKVEHVRKPKGAMREIVFSSDGQMQPMAAYYKEELKKHGYSITSSLIMPARKTWSCDFSKEGRPASVMIYPDDKNKSLMTVDLIYEIPSKTEEALREPKEDFDVVGPGEVAQQAPTPNATNKSKEN
ncbi:MAG TPA: hypothetical protein VMA09_01995 [Candidatus Binataceae bacterium]|nr:hypothetical protein [Candidatus Binataceae bacterium]